MRYGCWQGTLGGLFLEQLGEDFTRIAADYEAFLFRSTFALFLRLLRHLIVISHSFLSGENLVPRPGIGPGWSYPRECKSRLSTSSSTGAQEAQDVRAVDPFKDSPAPTLFEPSSAALNPSSLRTSCALKTRLGHGNDQVICEGASFGDT